MSTLCSKRNRVATVLGIVVPLFVGCTGEVDELLPGPKRSKERSPTAQESDEVTQRDQTSPAPDVESPEPEPVPDAGPRITAWTTAGPYALITPAQESSWHHGGTSNAGKDCLGCHTGAGAPRFVFAGTLYEDGAAFAPARGAQVRVVDARGDEIGLVGTDSSGNFWFPGSIELPVGAMVGVRGQQGERVMIGALTSGSCNRSGCHGASP